MLFLGTQEHIELDLKLQKYPLHDRVILHRWKKAQKNKHRKLPKISLSGAICSIQKPIPTLLGNFGSVKMFVWLCDLLG